MSRLWVGLAVSILLAACAPQAVPQAAALTATATTAPAATRTFTPIPPGATTTPAGTSTPEGTATLSGLDMANTEIVAMLTPSATPFQGLFAPGGVSGNLICKKFLIQNKSGKPATVIIWGNIEPTQNAVYYSYDVAGSLTISDFHWGNYQYTVMVDGTAISGSFRLATYDKTIMVIDAGGVEIVGP